LQFVRILSSDQMTLESNWKINIFNVHEKPM